ncbi:NTP transferase domain-containing protein [Chloroflexota bacterium]
MKCDECGKRFKTSQGLAGHKRLSHKSDELKSFLSRKQLHSKVINHMAEKIADKLADSFIESNGQEILDFYRAELSNHDFDLSSNGKFNNIRAIIIAAGESNRLLPIIKDKPACLLEIGDKTIIGRELENLRACGIFDISVVRGYQGDKIKFPAIRYYENMEYHNTGILSSLFQAKDEMDGAFLFSYSDIIYTKQVLDLLLQNNTDIVLVVDTGWNEHYRERYEHPIHEAELVKIEGDRIRQIGRNIIPPDEVHGEFIGLAKFSSKGAETLKMNYDFARNKYKAGPFHRAPSIDKAYFTDMIQELIDQGYPVYHVDIRDSWAEIDTMEDFGRVSRELHSVLKLKN